MALKKSEASELAVAEAALAAEAEEAKAAEAEEAEEEAKAAEKSDGLKLVKVVNLTHSTLFQHSTGLSIGPKAEKAMLDDGWLANQLKARLLKRV